VNSLRILVPAGILAFSAFAACGHSGFSSDGYLEHLGSWPTPSPDFDGPTGDSQTHYVTGGDGHSYRCSDTPYSLTTTPDKITTFDPNADVLWPGGLIQGGPLQQGVLAALPLTERAPLTISIPGLLASNNTMVVDVPTVASVQQAVGSLIDTAISQGVQAPSSISYTQTEAFSASQAALNLGISAYYVGGSFDASLAVSESANLHTVLVYFVQKMFTVAVPEPEKPGDLFEGLTHADIAAQVDAGAIGPTNLPVYVAGVTYGRIMTFSISSKQSTEQIRAALDAQYNGLVASGSISAAYSALLSDSSTSFSIVTVGGDAANAEAAIQTGDPTAFFAADAPISTAVPISYTLRYLGDNEIAAVSESTAYTVRTCEETDSGPGANFYIANGDGRVTAYDTSGGTIVLTTPVSVPGHTFAGIGYDPNDDDVFVLDQTGLSILDLRADGSTANSFPTGDGGSTRPYSLTFDPKYGRIWVPCSDTNGFCFVRAFTASGLDAGGVGSEIVYTPAPQGIAFDSTNNRLYESDRLTSQMHVWGIGSQGEILLPNGFQGLVGPLGVAYDEVHDRILVANRGGDTVEVYDPDGLPLLSIPTHAPDFVLYEAGRDRIWVIDQDESLVRAFRSDGTPIPLPPAAFGDLSNPLAMAFRP
jgi:DNA-binding beta-propeller fold protein YncE